MYLQFFFPQKDPHFISCFRAVSVNIRGYSACTQNRLERLIQGSRIIKLFV